jgi:hypothetical protein
MSRRLSGLLPQERYWIFWLNEAESFRLRAWILALVLWSVRMSENSNTAPMVQPPIIPSTLPVTDDISSHMQNVVYPLQLSFKLIALTTQVTVTDAAGRVVVHTNQKFFKFKEHVDVFGDRTRAVKLAEIKANQVIDWSARYNSTDASGQAIGSVGRKGWRSIWRAHYEVFNPEENKPNFMISEENPWVKFMDGLLGGIPILGMFSGYFFHPKYLAVGTHGKPVMRLSKLAAFFEGKFLIEKTENMDPREELNLILSFFMLVMLERQRG